MPIPKRPELEFLRSLWAALRNSNTIRFDGRSIETVRPSPEARPVAGESTTLPGSLIYRVALTQTGGAGGADDPPTYPTWTYTVTLNGATVGTGLAPTWGYYAAAFHPAATEGDGYYDATGAFVLMRTNTKPGTTDC